MTTDQPESVDSTTSTADITSTTTDVTTDITTEFTEASSTESTSPTLPDSGIVNENVTKTEHTSVRIKNSFKKIHHDCFLGIILFFWLVRNRDATNTRIFEF